MIKLRKSMRGFTLIEMVIVIALIVILALVIFYSVSDYMIAAKSATEKMESHVADVESVAVQVSAFYT